MKALPQLQPQPKKASSPEAEAALRQIDTALEKLRQQEERLRSPEKGRERRVWMGIVGYLNADLSADAKAYVTFLKILYELTPAFEFTEFGLTEFGKSDAFFFLPELSGARQSELISLAVHYQKPLKELLLWLCKPKSHPELRLEALRFLEANAHGEHWHIDFEDDPIEGLGDFDEEERPALYFVKKVKFDSAMSPVCKFIFEYVDDPPKPLPIRVCRRLGCKRFLLPERAGRKEYCSPGCCAMDHRPTPQENNDYMWLYRLNKIKSGGTLRKRLKADPNAMKRLDEIGKQWKKEPKFAEKVQQVRGRARL